MGKVYQEITPELTDWIGKQDLFFVATAPLAPEGLINCSPKGLDTFRILSPLEVIYLDLTGSGIETIAHLQENARIVIMFCAFKGSPRIVRIHGRGRVCFPDSEEFRAWMPLFPSLPGKRSVIHVQAERISDSCGYGVPLMEVTGSRNNLQEWAEKKGESGLEDYRQKKNSQSIDGLRGYPIG